MQKSLKLFALIFLLLSVFAQNSNAQIRKRRFHSKRDSLRAVIHSRDSVMQTFRKSDTSINGLLRKVEEYNSTYNDIKANLMEGVDTVDISKKLPQFEKRIKAIDSLINKDKSGTLRYLYAIRDFLGHINDQMDAQQSQLKDINDKLLQNQNDLAAIYKDSTLKIVPADSTLRKTFWEQKQPLMAKWKKLDSLNKKIFLKVGLLQNRVTAVYIGILDETDQINQKIQNFADNAFTCENGYIWDMTPTSSFDKALSHTYSMNRKLFSFFAGRDTLIHLAALLLLLLFYIWVYTNRHKILRVKESPDGVLSQANYVVKYPILSAIVVTFAIAPNFYDHPPVVFLESFFLVLITAILILAKNTAPYSIYRYLRQLYVLTIIYSISNLFIETSDTDRVAILLMAGLAVWASVVFLNAIKNPVEGLPPYTKAIIRAFMLLQGASFLCNVFGRFSLAKIIGITAIYNLWLALALYILIQMIMEALFLQLEANKSRNGISSYIDFKLLQDKFRNLLNIIAGILWLIMLSQNLDIEDAVDDYITNFLNAPHQLGKGGEFTFQSIIIFIAVIWLSSVMAKIISYLYDIAGQHELAVLKKKNRTSTLLIRIGVFTIGFFLAVAVSNFPIDKLTIIISAFGIGIGFGLQNVVNNLVSGLILAFEKPIQIGDIIEVDTRSGTVREIGIRSSKLTTADGAEVIIPNGDLISHHVINWTLSNNNRRVELIIGVAYGSDVEKVKGLLNAILVNHKDVMKEPAPLVFLNNLSESTVDFRMLFWAADITQWLSLKSNVLADVYNTLNKEGIEIPFPQQDVHLHLPDGMEPKKEE